MKPPPRPPWRSAILRMKNIQRPKNTSAGTTHESTSRRNVFSTVAPNFTPYFESSFASSVCTRVVTNFVAAGQRRFQRAVDEIAADRDLGDVAILEQLLELAVGNRLDLLRGDPRLAQPDHGEHREQHVPQVDLCLSLHARSASATVMPRRCPSPLPLSPRAGRGSKDCPRRGVVARFLASPIAGVDTRIVQARAEVRREQHEIHAEAGIPEEVLVIHPER